MARLGRPGLTDEQKAEVWLCWQGGEGYSDLGRALGKFPASIFGILRLHSGYTPLSRKRSATHLSLAEREEISRGLVSGRSIRDIAGQLGRAPSTITREVNRDGRRHRYRAAFADEKAWQRAGPPKLCRLARHGALRRLVATKLAQDGSPEQIAGWVKRTYPDEGSLHVSHKTIYKSPFVQSRGVLKKELQKHLRTKRSPFPTIPATQ